MNLDALLARLAARLDALADPLPAVADEPVEANDPARSASQAATGPETPRQAGRRVPEAIAFEWEHGLGWPQGQAIGLARPSRGPLLGRR